MKFARLQAENLLKLVAIDVTPEGHVITIGGKNKAGKSSFLNSIAVLLGGASMAPDEPIRDGEHEAYVQGDMDADMVIRRRFWYPEVAQPRPDDVTDEEWDARPREYDRTDLRSSLTITNKAGTAKFTSPQSMLDKIVGVMAFDPLEFADMGKKAGGTRQQRDLVAKIAGIDFTLLDRERKKIFDDRTFLKRTQDTKVAQALLLPKHADAPPDEVSLAELTEELRKADEYRTLAEDAEKAAEKATNAISYVEADVNTYQAGIDRINRQIAALEKERDDLTTQKAFSESNLEDAKKAADAARITADAARAVVPDTADIRTRLAAVEATNTKVRENKAHADALTEIATFDEAIADATRQLEAIDDRKVATLTAATFPIEGLTIDDDGVRFNGKPFNQASDAEQLQVSVAIGAALNPELKMMCVRNGNVLDEDSFALLETVAAQYDLQIFMEWVTKNADDVQVMLVEGRQVASGEVTAIE